MRFEGKHIVVTGGSRGIGAGIAKALAKEGATVAITYSTKADAAKAVVDQLPGSGHIVCAMNLADENSIETAFSEIFKTFPKIDGLVNNAGQTRDQLSLRMKTEDFDSVIQSNLRGSYLCTRQVLKPMLKARIGSVVFISSVIAHTGNPGQANYAASKGGIEALSRSFALEFGSRSMRFNCVAPGFITTDMTDVLPDEVKNNILGKIPLGHFGEVEDIANATLFLLSNDSKYITGQTLHVNGGAYV